MHDRIVLRRIFGILLAVLVPVLAIGGLSYARAVPDIDTSTATLTAPVGAPTLFWPDAGQSAVGAVGSGVFASYGAQTPVATASVAKIITALAVLKQKPLSPGEQGPTLTLGSADVNFYNQYKGQGGSVTAVSDGEQISEYQALEAMLLPSADNMADSLAVWAFGSLNAYHAYATQLIQSLGLTDTAIGSDASGFSPDTTSTAQDLVLLGGAALQNPVLAKIVSEHTATIPIAGTIKNTDTLLGQDGFVGIKTGNSDQDAGCFLGAATITLSGGQSVTIVAAAMNQVSLPAALSNVSRIVESAKNAFSVETPVKAGQTLVTYHAPWLKHDVTAIASKNLTAAAWQGTVTLPHFNLTPVHVGLKTGAQVGTISVTAGTQTVTSPVVLTHDIPPPSFWWRVFR